MPFHKSVITTDANAAKPTRRQSKREVNINLSSTNRQSIRGVEIDVTEYFKNELDERLKTDLDKRRDSFCSLEFFKSCWDEEVTTSTKRDGKSNSFCSSIYSLAIIIIGITFASLSIYFLYQGSPIFNERFYQLDIVSSNILRGVDITEQQNLFPLNISSFFLKKNSMLQTNEIPLLLTPYDDIEGNHKFSNVLSECFGLKSISLKEYFEELYKNTQYSHDFYVSSMSLCDFKHSKSMNNNKFRVISFIQNPIISYITSHDKHNDISNIQGKNNILTRSITCESNNDIIATKRFLYGFCEIGTTNNYYNFMQMLVDRYNWKLKDDNTCIENFKEYLDSMDLYYVSASNNNDEQFDLFKELNSQDFIMYNELSPLV